MSIDQNMFFVSFRNITLLEIIFSNENHNRKFQWFNLTVLFTITVYFDQAMYYPDWI